MDPQVLPSAACAASMATVAPPVQVPITFVPLLSWPLGQGLLLVGAKVAMFARGSRLHRAIGRRDAQEMAKVHEEACLVR